MKHLPKHLRPRWRYLAITLETDGEGRGRDNVGDVLTRRSFQRELWYAGQNLLGDPGSADADLTVVRFRFDREAGRGETIVRVRHGEVDRARAAVACLHDIDDAAVGVAVRKVSGTIRAAEAAF